ncbi:MAG: type I restriction enzyme HsdR N-terminal domain-containing protein [Bacteroidota bacterium]|nr:MAG: type I restriction enzyme HsdR N-terminal domain-containing protein [Bacteroidota bacterium]
MNSKFLQTENRSGKVFIFDPVRKKWFVLTPEEWVRQYLLKHMVENLNYPISLISVEKQIRIGQRNRRYDVVVYQKDQPWLIIECKQEKESISHQSLSQVLAYVSQLPVRFCVSAMEKKSIPINWIPTSGCPGCLITLMSKVY